MKKKMISVILAAALAGTLAGCSTELSNEYVTVAQYKGLEVPAPAQTEVTDEQVDLVIESNLAGFATREEITDRPAQTGDVVNIDYTGYIDGEAFEGGSAAAAGHNIGDEFDITVQFPEEYSQNPYMEGAVAEFHIVLNSIAVEKVPELTDEWVQQNSEESETVEEYRDEIRSTLEESTEDSVRAELQDSVLNTLLENTEVKKYPEDVVSAQEAMFTEAYTQMAEMYEMELGEFLETYMQTTEEELNQQAKEYAQQSAVLGEAVKLIAEKENLEPTEEEYTEGYAEYAEQSGYEDVQAFIDEVGEDALRSQIRQDAVAEYLVDECVQVEQTESAQ